MDDKNYYWRLEEKDRIDGQLAGVPLAQNTYEAESVELTWFRPLSSAPLKRWRTISESGRYNITFRRSGNQWNPNLGSKSIKINIRD